MRLRLQTSSSSTSASACLPPLKAWFSYKTSSGKTISHLKESICTTIALFSCENLQPDELCCELDGFELLDELDVDGVLREGDLIVLQRRKISKTTRGIVNRKRKSSLSVSSSSDSESSLLSEDSVRRRAHLQKQGSSSRKRKRADSSSDSSSSDSESSSSSSSSSDSDSSESSDASSSSLSSAPSIRPSKPKPPVISKTHYPSTNSVVSKPRPPKTSSQPNVPPGLGSVQTHKRNLRRRLKKKYDAAQKDGFTLDPETLGRKPLLPNVPKGTSDANSVALGSAVRKLDRIASSASSTPKRTQQQEKVRAPSSTLVQRQTPSVSQSQAQTPEPWAGMDSLALSMFSLGNKNKKKGFKSSMAMRMPRAGKKVFADEETAVQEQQKQRQVAGSVVAVADRDGGASASHTTPSSSFTFTHPLQLPAEPQSEARARPLRVRPRLIPPSERYAAGQLPKNMFVTSVDVEAEYGQSADGYGYQNENENEGKKKKKDKKNGKKAGNGNENGDVPAKKKQKTSYWDDDLEDTQMGVALLPGVWESVGAASGSVLGSKSHQATVQVQSEEVTMLDYGEPEAEGVANASVNGFTNRRSFPDFVSTDRVERDYDDDGEELGDVETEEPESKQTLIWTVAGDPDRWEAFSKVKPEGENKAKDLSPGILVGWKALSLNPITFSPEIMLHIGTIVSVSIVNSDSSSIPDSSSAADAPSSIKVKLLPRPGISPEDLADLEEDVDDEGNKTFSWDDVVGMDWRILEGISM